MIVPTETTETNGAALLDRSADEPAPLGSMFKLYVLLAVSHAVDEGTLSWDTTLTVEDYNRSLPSGTLQEEPNGTAVSVREAATQMIEISDNTATDMLIQELGRDAIEDAVKQSGHHDPELLLPFPTTREMFLLGWGDPEDLDTWQTGTPQEQRALLDQLARQPLDPHDIAVGGDPLWDKGVEWFASAYDVAAVHQALQDQQDPVVREILSQNHGLEQHVWDYVAFKGGSSPGVVSGSWFVEDGTGDSYVVVLQGSTTDAAGISADSQALFFRLANAAVELTREPG